MGYMFRANFLHELLVVLAYKVDSSELYQRSCAFKSSSINHEWAWISIIYYLYYGVPWVSVSSNLRKDVTCSCFSFKEREGCLQARDSHKVWLYLYCLLHTECLKKNKNRSPKTSTLSVTQCWTTTLLPHMETLEENERFFTE